MAVHHSLLRELPLSLPIARIALGAALFSLQQVMLRLLPILFQKITERFSASITITITLMGARLKINWVFRWRDWTVTWCLLAVTMPLGIITIMLVTAWSLSLPWAIALLLAAGLASINRVLAADIQVEPPKSGGGRDAVELHPEAGLNNGLAFPFVHLAIVLATMASRGLPSG